MAREAQYTAQISALVTPEMKARLVAIDKTYANVGQGDAIRRALDIAIDQVEREYATGAVETIDGAAVRPVAATFSG